MAKNSKEKDPMNRYQIIEGNSINFETVPPEKNKTRAEMPKVKLELLKDGEEYISIKAENTRIEER